MPALRQHGLDVRSILLHRSFSFISCAAVISRIKYCYGSVIVSCGMFTLGAGVAVPEFGSCCERTVFSITYASFRVQVRYPSILTYNLVLGY